MFRKIICYFLAGLILGGSVILPLGDFSLIRDIPGMYHNYTKIAASDELSVMDFIGDYLLHGKDLFGHNEHDKPQSATNSVQFQHPANPLSIVLFRTYFHVKTSLQSKKKYPVCYKPIAALSYHQVLFRPPIAALAA
jgi:hypothetical protein